MMRTEEEVKKRLLDIQEGIDALELTIIESRDGGALSRHASSTSIAVMQLEKENEVQKAGLLKWVLGRS